MKTPFSHFHLIEEFPGYSISRRGEVLGKSARRKCVWLSDGGYLLVSLYKNNKRHDKPVHQLVLKAFGPPKPSPKHEPNHKDGDKTNNNISNLEWVTHQENMQHAYDTGLLARENTKEQRAKISETLKGRTKTKEHRAAISRGLIGNTNSKGCKRSKETKIKMRGPKSEKHKQNMSIAAKKAWEKRKNG